MKKIFCLISIFVLFLTLPVFAEYKPIPKELSKQYKAEMEQIMEEEYPKVIKMTDCYFLEGENIYKNFITKGFDRNTFSTLQAITYEGIPLVEMPLYAKLTKVTKEKYLGIKYEPFDYEWVTPYHDFLLPYFKDNNVKTKVLSKTAHYSGKKYNTLENYIKHIEKKFLSDNED